MAATEGQNTATSWPVHAMSAGASPALYFFLLLWITQPPVGLF